MSVIRRTAKSSIALRILYLHQYFVSPNGPGITRSYEFARRLIAHGHDVQMITSTGMLSEQYASLRKTSRLQIAGIPTTVIPVSYSNHMSFSRRMGAFFQFAAVASREAMMEKADVIFATSTPLTIAIPAIAAKLWQRKPMVFEVRDLWPELPIQIGALQNPIARAAAYALEWTAYHSADYVIALSPGIEDGVRRRGISGERIFFIPNCCDTDIFDVSPDQGMQVREELGLLPNQPLVLYAGTFGVLNNVQYLVEVAAHVHRMRPDIHFLLVGSGAEYDRVVSAAREHDLLNKTVHIWQPRPKKDMPRLFAAATASTVLFQPIQSMWQTNSANKFFDALAAAKPVIINFQSGWQADLLRETGAGISLSPSDYGAAARQLANFVTNTKCLEDAATASRKLAYTRFHRDSMADKLERVLLKAAAL